MPRWKRRCEDFSLGLKEVLVSNLDCNLGCVVLEASLGPNPSHNLEKVLVIHNFQSSLYLG